MNPPVYKAPGSQMWNCLLIEDDNRLILIDSGMGNKQSEKFFGYYSLWGTHSMDASLAKYGLTYCSANILSVSVLLILVIFVSKGAPF